MNNSFAIGIPTINRADLLNPTLDKYFLDFPDVDIFIIDNGSQNIHFTNDKFNIYKPSENFGVAKSWNYLCAKIFEKNDNALILNDDVYLGRKQNQVYDFIEKSTFSLATCQKKFHMCSFILNKNCFIELKFDQDFHPAYFEDKDYLYRLSLQGKLIKESSLLNPEIFINSATISKNGGDPEINKNFQKLEDLYVKKWGGLPGKEKFKTAFNK